jgi:hypothetical protein
VTGDAHNWKALVEGSPGARDLATAAGALCLDEHAQLQKLRRQSGSGQTVVRDLEQQVIAFGPSLDDGPLDVLLDDEEMLRTVDLLEAAWPLAALGLLRGLCRSVLTRYFTSTFDVIDLAYGQPFPLPTRPTHEAIEDATPNPQGADDGHLLERTGFRLSTVRPGSHVSLRLDFSMRTDLDTATWDEATKRFPKVATIHPYADSDALSAPRLVTPEYWFGVYPTEDAWATCELPALLATAAAHQAKVAIAPELCLPSADALADLLANEPTRYPPLVIPGTAHEPRVLEGTTAEDAPACRTNSAVAYLNGVPLLRHDKIHPFSTKDLGQEEAWTEARPEGLTGEPRTITVAAGERTRFAVLICADLNDHQMPGLLSLVGTNFLVVPAMTPHEGPFSAVPSTLAGHCQGLSIVVNGSTRNVGTGSPPFMVMVAVPRRHPADQIRSFPEPAGGRRAIGIIDPNRPLDEALTWV